MTGESKPIISWRSIPSLNASHCALTEAAELETLWKTTQLSFTGGGGSGIRCNFACVSVVERVERRNEFAPTSAQLVKHPLAILACVPKDAALFAAGAVAGAAAKTVTAPLDRIKILMQTHGIRVGQQSAKKVISFLEAITMIGKEEGIKGYWKGNLPQVIRIIPYSAVQLFAYEAYKKLFRGKDGELSLVGRLAAGACAGMTSTFVTYPLDVLRLRLAVEPGYRTMSEIALNMLREEGVASFYYGLGPSLIGIAPYIAGEEVFTGGISKERSISVNRLGVSFPSHTHMLSFGYCEKTDANEGHTKTVLDAIPGIVARDGLIGLYRGFLPNALKTLPNSSIRLTTYDMVKRLIATSQKEFQRIVEENRNKQQQKVVG
ncbi:hypothetical protein Pyn_35719 [Prunus yedoensis var. nudiflora]|uniref:Uncharacterized protein n=1 Tax=Prunus yedoensis var. nudiflora TaxID=2094558 RepID=A0A314UK23_PRUYE|nr:hypothetical protein Pyn_35719 [Prunus yedoensis var. nudiflora]